MATEDPVPSSVTVNPAYDQAAVHQLCCGLPALAAAVDADAVIYHGRNLLFRWRWQDADWVVKSFRRPDPWQRLAGAFRRGKAERSYTYAVLLDRFGVATPEPLACATFPAGACPGTWDSFYVCRHLAGHVQVRVLHDAACPHREELVTALGAWTADLHKRGVLHRDFTVGNILFAPGAAEPDWQLVDVNRLRFGRVSVERGIRNLVQLEQRGRMGELLLDAYCVGRGLEPSGVRSFYGDVLRRHLLKFEFKNRSRGWRRRLNPFRRWPPQG